MKAAAGPLISESDSMLKQPPARVTVRPALGSRPIWPALGQGARNCAAYLSAAVALPCYAITLLFTLLLQTA